MKDLQMVKVGKVEIGSGIPKICVSLMGSTKDEIIENAKVCAEKQPDLIEWRADFFQLVNDFDAVKDVLEAISPIIGDIPLIFTLRTTSEGGNQSISLKDYISLHLFVSEMPYVHMVDIEYYMQPARMKELMTQIKRNRKIVIASHHCITLTPPYSKMIKILEEMELAGADITKLAVMPQRESDVNNLMLTVNEGTCGRLSQPIIAMAMGPRGVVSRISGEVYGSSVTFGCIGEPSAPGQLSIDILREELNRIHEMVEKITV